jgi:hypothetical protein
MQKHLYLYAAMIILIIILGGYMFKFRENFINSPVHGGYDRPGPCAYSTNGPYNYTQTEFIKLQDVLDKFQSGKPIQLSNSSKCYTLIPATTDEEIIHELDAITDIILSKLNTLYSEPDYTSKFTKTDYDHIVICHDKDNNLNIVYDIFIQEKQRFPYGVQIRVNLIKYNLNKDDPIGNNRIVKNLKVDKTPFHLPSYAFNNEILNKNGASVIPSPLNALSTPHWPILDTVNWVLPGNILNIKAIHINSIKLRNSSLIIYPDKYAPRIGGGISDTTLEYSCYNNARNYASQKPNIVMVFVRRQHKHLCVVSLIQLYTLIHVEKDYILGYLIYTKRVAKVDNSFKRDIFSSNPYGPLIHI